LKSAKPAMHVNPMRRIIAFRRTHERRYEALAFLPAALEIVETPPSPIGRAIGVTIIMLFCAALVWAWWGTIDIVASATGKIVPSGRTKVIQPFETGVVRRRIMRPCKSKSVIEITSLRIGALLIHVRAISGGMVLNDLSGRYFLSLTNRRPECPAATASARRDRYRG